MIISNMCKEVTFLALFILPSVKGHGYMYSPRSRNWVAHQDGTDSGEPGLPPREYCPHCLNKKSANAVCGVGNNGVNYDEWLDSQGNPIPWNSQATYTEGDYITVNSFLSTNHAGHMDLFLCPDESNLTQDCFLSHPVEYIYSTHHAPRDLKFPWRGYYSNDADFEMTYKLPMGLYGDKVMMQWRYVTGNSCMSPGYCCHNADDYFDLYQNVSSWKRANTALCDYPLNPEGLTGAGKPEQFWNCAEITIVPSGTRQPTISSSPTTTQSPTSSPIVTSSPTIYPTSISAHSKYCCSFNYKYCGVDGHCNESSENCAGCNGLWIDDSISKDCESLWQQCFDVSDDCCGPASCVDVNGDGSYMQCKPHESITTPAPTIATPVETSSMTPTKVPTKDSTPSPTLIRTRAPTHYNTPVPTRTAPNSSSTYCCSHDGYTCTDLNDGFCNGSQSNCEGNCNGSYIDPSSVTNAPSSASGSGGCCSWDPTKGCEQPENNYCHENQDNCEGNCNGNWLSS